MNEFFVKRYENEINNISYEKAKQGINVKQVFSNRLIVVKYCIFIIVILLEIAMFTSFLSKDLFNPVFALIETSIVLITIIYFFRLNFKSFSKSYLIRYYSCCSIVFSIASFIVCCSSWLLLLTYSGKMTSEFYLQLLVLTVFSIAGWYFILLIIYNYMKYRIKQELSLFVKDIRVPKVGKVIEKTTSYGIIVIIGVMQFYRMNKFWIESNESNAINAIIALGQLIVGILCFLILIILPIRMFYPNFISSMLLKKYSEEFRLDYGFSKKEWYEG
ncbi:hypothetical protein HRE78_09805 [Enterococcus faecalis]|nr:hypothetical protein [Enterococcus faecalis]